MPPQNFPPPPFLENIVQNFWYIEREFSPPTNIFTVLPDSRIELIFSFGVSCFSDLYPDLMLSPCFVVGLLDTPLPIRAEGMVRLMGVRFYPWGFQPLLGHLFSQPLSGLQVGSTPLQRIAYQLESSLQDSVQVGVDALQSFLIKQALFTSLKEDAAFVAAAKHILGHHDTLNLAELAEATFISPRTLRRKFQTILGKNPKTLARIARFESVRDALWNDPDMELSNLAVSSGYADQAHMQREFRRFSHQTPRQFANAMRQTRVQFNP